jgi:hypothetical protein
MYDYTPCMICVKASVIVERNIEFNYFMVPTAVPQLDHGTSPTLITLHQ